MKKLTQIALIEPFDHSEVLYTLCELLLEQDVELWIFCQEYIAQDSPGALRSQPKIHWHTFTTDKRKQFFFQQREFLNQCQLLIWITAPPSAYRWINKLDLQVPFVLLLHNLHTWLTPWTNLQLSRSSLMEGLSDLGRLIRFTLWNRPQQRRLLKKAAAIGVPSQNMLGLVKEFRRSRKMPKAFFVPFAYADNPFLTDKNEVPLQIVIPGVVSRNGRDYQLVAEALGRSLPQFESPVHLVLLGKTMEMSVIGPMKNLELKYDGFSLTYFTERLPQKTYDEYLKKAHFMILPYQPYQKFGIVREKWGASKISGGISDMIRFGIPAICSAHYQLDTEIKPLTASFLTQEELAELLIDWVNRRAYRSHRLATQEMDKTARSTQLLRELSQLI